MSNKHTSSRSSDIPEPLVINKDTYFENGIIGEKLLSRQVVEKLDKIDKLQRDNADLMNRVKELERKLMKSGINTTNHGYNPYN